MQEANILSIIITKMAILTNNTSYLTLALLALGLAVAGVESVEVPVLSFGPGPALPNGLQPRFGFGGLVGGSKDLKGAAFNKAKDLLEDALQKVAAQGNFNFAIVNISWIKAKPASGMKFTFKVALKDIKAGKEYQCEVTILEQPWKNPSKEVSLDCAGIGGIKLNF